MKRSLLLLAACFAGLNDHAQSNQTLVSKIERVTVFLQGAQVERSAHPVLKPGKYTIVFEGISPKIDKRSIQVTAEGKLTILSVTHHLNFIKEQQVQDEIKLLETQKEQWVDKTGMEKDLKNVYVQEEKMILSNQSIKGDATLKAADLKEVADFQRQRLTEVYQRLQEIDHTLKKMSLELEKIDRQLAELNQKKDLSTSEILVAVDVKEAAPANFRLSYLVQQSSWFPSYDIRVQDITHPIGLMMKANINQQSGEDWADVHLRLSTGNPDENSTSPSLVPWQLGYAYTRSRGTSFIPRRSDLTGSIATTNNYITGTVRGEDGRPLVSGTVSVKGTRIATTTDANGNFSLTTPPGTNTIVIFYVGYSTQELSVSTSGYANIAMNQSNSDLSEVVVMGYGSKKDNDGDNDVLDNFKQKKANTAIATHTTYQPTTTIFEIETPYSVPNDGKTYTVEINNSVVDAQYEYVTVPKLDASAYLTARITDWQELNLLPGEANLFFEGTYLGTSLLDLASAGDTLKLSLGKDKAVIVKRTLLKQFSSKKFLGSNKTDSRQYEISIRNNKSQPIRIVVEDQFPISTNKDIEIEKLSYDNAKLDDDSRKLTWSLTIEGKNENKLQMGYTVKYPKDKILILE